MAWLVVFGGLPGTGKTTVSRALSVRLGAVHLRIDAIEQAIRSAAIRTGAIRTGGIREVGAAGYSVANALAEANLALGLSVVADCVNPVRESRLGWRKVADDARAGLLEIELVCSDIVEHRRRVDTRATDIPGLALPTWDAVTRHEFEPWQEDHLVFDTAVLSSASVLERCEVPLGGRDR